MKGGRQGKYSMVFFEYLCNRENNLVPGVNILFTQPRESQESWKKGQNERWHKGAK